MRGIWLYITVTLKALEQIIKFDRVPYIFLKWKKQVTIEWSIKSFNQNIICQNFYLKSFQNGSFVIHKKLRKYFGWFESTSWNMITQK